METVQGIRRISLPGSTLKHDERVNVFWLDAGGGILVDVGWDTDQSFSALQEALPHPPRHVLITHLHPDHAGGVNRVRAWTDGEIYLPREDIPVGGSDLPPDVLYFEDEQPLTLSGVHVQVVLTPGHTPGHRCFVFSESGGLVTGDMVLGEGTTWVGPPHGDMADYLASLERLRTLGHRFLCPGHGPIQTDPVEKIDAFIAHRLMRERQVLDSLGEGISAPTAIVARNYAETPAYLHPLAEIVVRAHLQKLQKEGRVRQDDDRFSLVSPA